MHNLPLAKESITVSFCLDYGRFRKYGVISFDTFLYRKQDLPLGPFALIPSPLLEKHWVRIFLEFFECLFSHGKLA